MIGFFYNLVKKAASSEELMATQQKVHHAKLVPHSKPKVAKAKDGSGKRLGKARPEEDVASLCTAPVLIPGLSGQYITSILFPQLVRFSRNSLQTQLLFSNFALKMAMPLS